MHEQRARTGERAGHRRRTPRRDRRAAHAAPTRRARREAATAPGRAAPTGPRRTARSGRRRPAPRASRRRTPPAGTAGCRAVRWRGSRRRTARPAGRRATRSRPDGVRAARPRSRPPRSASRRDTPGRAARIDRASVPGPAPTSTTVNGSGRPMRSHSASRYRPIDDTEQRAHLGRRDEVAAPTRRSTVDPHVEPGLAVQGELHEPLERDRPRRRSISARISSVIALARLAPPNLWQSQRPRERQRVCHKPSATDFVAVTTTAGRQSVCHKHGQSRDRSRNGTRTDIWTRLRSRGRR